MRIYEVSGHRLHTWLQEGESALFDSLVFHRYSGMLASPGDVARSGVSDHCQHWPPITDPCFRHGSGMPRSYFTLLSYLLVA